MPAFATDMPLPDVKAGGALPPGVDDKIKRVVVEAQRNLPAMCEIELSDIAVLDEADLTPGTPLTVATAPASEDPAQASIGPVFDGEIVALEADFPPGGGSRLVVRGYDRSHRLHRTRRTRTFLRQSDNMVATAIASDCGLTPQVDATGGTHEYLCQRNQTDWEFLTERAREIGFEFVVSPLPGGQSALVFRKAGKDPTAGPTQRLEHGDNLRSFRLRVTSAEQAQATTVRAWDPVRREEVAAQAQPPEGESEPQDPRLSASAIAGQFGSTADVVAGRPFAAAQAELAADHATAHREHAASAAFEAEGSCIGNPALTAGGQVTIDELGPHFSGTYTLSSVRHVFDENGFTTRFTVSGTHDRSLLGLTRPGASWHAGTSGGNGGASLLATPVIGTVTNTNDPQQAGRVKVEFRWLAESVESHWSPVVSAGAGEGKGLQVVPEVGDQVLVVFEHADVRRPFVVGGIWGQSSELPEPQAVQDGRTRKRVLLTPAGHRLELSDEQQAGGITLQVSGRDGPSASLAGDPDDKISLTAGDNELVINGGQRAITLRSAGDLTVEARGRLTLTGTTGVEIDGGSGMVNVKSSSSLTLDGGGMAELKGGTVKIN